jgi:hypothetical protein
VAFLLLFLLRIELRCMMKRLIIILFLLFLSAGFKANFAQDNDGDVNAGFYASLSPYGSWIELSSGVTVWRPQNLHHDWTPYRYGHWIWTDDGWYWDSDEPYGPIVYHYGRWYNDDYYGWIWVPDNVWAPAWVEWRYNDNYIGWAPLAPYASFSVGIGISFTRNYETPMSYWHFVGYRHMCDMNVYNYYVPDHDRYRIYSGTKYRTNYGYSNGRVINRGVDVDYIRQRGGGRITERQIQRVDDPRSSGSRGNNNVVRAYIPSREQLAKTDTRNVEIKRATRSSSLDISKVNLGRRNPVANNDNNSRPDSRTPGREAQRNNSSNNVRENNHPEARAQNNQPERINAQREVQPRVQNQEPQARPNRNQPPSIQTQPQVRQQQPRVQAEPQVRQQQPRVQAQPQVRQQQPRVQSQPQVRQQQPRVQAQPQVRQQQPRVQSQQQRREAPQPAQRQQNGNNKSNGNNRERK